MTENPTAENAAQAAITPSELADSLAEGEGPVVVDVRESPQWRIEAPGLELHSIPAERALADAAALAGRIERPIAVVCARGKTAIPVAAELRAAGADARVLEGGMSGWLAVLQDREVDASLPGDGRIVQVQRPGRGCLSYLVASEGTALVVDPAPDAGYYADLAARLGVRITDVVDTHLHADHISGARELVALTGARLRLPGTTLERGVAYGEDVLALGDGERISVGALKATAIALPGHTSDMTGLLIEAAEGEGGEGFDSALIAGDSLFADGIARPDLQRGDPRGAREMAKRLHATLRERILSLGDGTILLPGHAEPGVRAEAVAPTLEAVRRANALLAIADAGEFADALLEGMPPRPANYETIITVNSGLAEPSPDLEDGGNSCSAGSVAEAGRS